MKGRRELQNKNKKIKIHAVSFGRHFLKKYKKILKNFSFKNYHKIKQKEKLKKFQRVLKKVSCQKAKIPFINRQKKRVDRFSYARAPMLAHSSRT